MEVIRHDSSTEIDLPNKTPHHRHLKWRKLQRYIPAVLLLSPLTLLILGFFIVPMLYILYLSFIVTDDLYATNATYSIQNYIAFFTDPYYLSSLWTTIKISSYSTIICLLLGYPVALTMSRCTPRVRGYLTLLVASPLLISVIVRNFGWYILLLPNGTINQILMSLGIIDSPLKLLFSEIGVVIGLSSAYLPYMILSIATCLYNLDPSLGKAGAILGASPRRTFISITLPLSLPGVVSGVVLVFSLSMSSYVTPALMGGPNIKVLPVVAYDQIMHLFRWTYGSAISYVLLGITLAAITIFTRMFEKGRFKEVFR
ncbi:ABC transporter permease [Neobacillus sp. 114]|uniref:ABC transporter permease n=1 Tax=Neobacillus sp. 114 TaxID=3048535 RepID=UPI0024C24916|nr:ABC transporter permease [Neobacillus sp. 114]